MGEEAGFCRGCGGAQAGGGRADADLKVSAVSDVITVTASTPSVLETPTVSQNLYAQGQECARRAAGLVTGPTRRHPTRLVIRRSTL